MTSSLFQLIDVPNLVEDCYDGSTTIKFGIVEYLEMEFWFGAIYACTKRGDIATDKLDFSWIKAEQLLQA